VNIVVCVKQVMDPEAPATSFKIDITNDTVISSGVSQVISTFDDYAVEAALRIKESRGGKITVISMGTNLQRDVVKKPLSMGADELVLLEDEAFAGSDSWSTASVLALAIRKIGSYDVILCGRQAADWDSGQVGSGIAQLLGLPIVSIARKIEVNDNRARVERVITDGYEVVEVALPALITLSNEHDEPRYPNVRGIMAAKKKEPVVWKPSDIGLDSSQVGVAGRRIKLLKLFQPAHEGECEMIDGDSPSEMVEKLAVRLREAKVI
jgi:electron transfer flavoprotein beta subunit